MSDRIPDDTSSSPVMLPCHTQEQAQIEQSISEPNAVDDNSPSARARRSVYSFLTNFIGLGGIIYLSRFAQGPVAENAVSGLADICMFTTAAYLGISVVDRSRILSHIGDRIRRGPQV